MFPSLHNTLRCVYVPPQGRTQLASFFFEGRSDKLARNRQQSMAAVRAIAAATLLLVTRELHGTSACTGCKAGGL